FFFSSRRRHTRLVSDWSSDVCSSDLDMVATLGELGGLHTLEDFAVQAASYVEPISTRYHQIDLFELPPSNHGVVALILLKMLERSEERRVGKEGRARGAAEREKRRGE